MSDSEKPLKVCPDCGWYDGYTHKRYDECEPKKGAVVDAMVKAVPEIPSTRLGYGRGNMVFEISEDVHVRLDVHADGTFRVSDVYVLGHYEQKDVAELVRAIAGTAIGRGTAVEREERTEEVDDAI